MAYNGKREVLILKRRQSLMPQAAVACELNMSQAQYSNIENGYTSPSKEIAEKLIAMFNLDSDYFVNEEKEDTQ